VSQSAAVTTTKQICLQQPLKLSETVTGSQTKARAHAVSHGWRRHAATANSSDTTTTSLHGRRGGALKCNGTSLSLRRRDRASSSKSVSQRATGTDRESTGARRGKTVATAPVQTPASAGPGRRGDQSTSRDAAEVPPLRLSHSVVVGYG